MTLKYHFATLVLVLGYLYVRLVCSTIAGIFTIIQGYSIPRSVCGAYGVGVAIVCVER